ncbi:integrator complex subunit 8 isoform X2 [Copidosoma floridanum]|uniref:integrator complex subunit 8 isoform X2 n=1 Tax=Copidosoma floridanum TaxID=29053 RepID=UPI000C6F9040|nr:integrator complex subunit 8 isoform X2 [Copidosoma floridanum]
MDVDLLRPGTVPISPDTVLWFEFLLNPSLLEKHISKPSPDPSATDLITKFITINLEQTNEQNTKVIDVECNDVKVNPTPKWSYKNIALKILSLKVAAYLKWDLDLLLDKLPLHIQVVLLQDLFFITMDIVVEIPVLPDNLLDISSERVLFTLVLYHRWVLKAIVNRALNNKLVKPFPNSNSAIQENSFAASAINDELIRKLDAQAANSIHFLNAVLLAKDLKPKILKFDTFQILTEDSTEVKQDWNNVFTITEDELKCQIHYDLAVFHLLKEENKLAQTHISQAKELYAKLDTSKPLLYCSIEKEYLEGYCLACEVPVEGKSPSLTEKLFRSIKNQYANVIEILQADNLAREIILVHRDNLELDIEGGVANRKIVVPPGLLLQIQCLNLVRRVLDNEVLLGNYAFYIRTAKATGLEVLFWAFDGVLDKATDLDKQRIARYLLYLVIMGEIDGLASAILAKPKYVSLFNEKELMEIKKESLPTELDIPSILLSDDWDIEPIEIVVKKNELELHRLENRLISSYDPRDIEILLRQIMRENPNYPKPLWQLHHSWEIPIPLQSVISSMPQGFLKDFFYILLAKSKDLALVKDFMKAKSLLKIVENEIQRNAQSLNEACHKSSLLGGNNIVYKLTRLVSWELLLTEICHSLYAWPPNKICDTEAVTTLCKQCISTIQSSDQLIPRQEIIEYCLVFLLNMSEWDYLMSLEKQWSTCEFAAALSNVAKHKNQKFSKEAWDIVLAACKQNRDMPQKRSSSNSGSANTGIIRDSLASISSTLYRLREANVLNIAISLLARLHNVLRDESFELNAVYLNIWPASIPSPKSYNPKIISEILFQLLTIALKYYPTNVPWLRLMADLNFVLGHHESAMKYYLEAIIVATDFFTLPIRNHIEDSVFRRMIKCCTHLQCYTQAVVLCQFLEEVDYPLAFKMAGNETKSVTLNDAMDAYYNCIWDTTILEYLINLHAKRGEHHRKQLAIKNIGLLELNSNNNEEIQREAANVRKARFLRALSKQYVYNV